MKKHWNRIGNVAAGAMIAALFLSGCQVEDQLKAQLKDQLRSQLGISQTTEAKEDEENTELETNASEAQSKESAAETEQAETETTLEETTVEAVQETVASEYYLESSDKAYLSEEDVRGFTLDDIRIARNEIYARHGRRFKDAALQAYFDGKSWYHGTVEPNQFRESSLNEYEKYNVAFLKDAEPAAGSSNLAEAPNLSVLDQYGYVDGHSVLSFSWDGGTAKDCGDYYEVYATYGQGIEAPGNLKMGDQVTLVFNQMTGEKRTLTYGKGGLYEAGNAGYDYPNYYYTPSADGSPVVLYQDSDDRVDKPVYQGVLYIRKDATVEIAIVHDVKPVTFQKLNSDYNWYNGIVFDQKGYATRLVFYGD